MTRRSDLRCRLALLATTIETLRADKADLETAHAGCDAFLAHLKSMLGNHDHDLYAALRDAIAERNATTRLYHAEQDRRREAEREVSRLRAVAAGHPSATPRTDGWLEQVARYNQRAVAEVQAAVNEAMDDVRADQQEGVG